MLACKRFVLLAGRDMRRTDHATYWSSRAAILQQRLESSRDPVVRRMLEKCLATALEAVDDEQDANAAEVPTRTATRTRSCLASGPCDP